MSTNMLGGLIGLSILSRSNSFMDYASTNVSDTRAVRVARAQFTTPATTPPWKEAASTTPVSSQVSAIKRLLTIIDKAPSSAARGQPDVDTSFTTYKALDKLRLLAEAAARSTISVTERAALASTFKTGIADLQTFLGQASSDKVELSFGLPTRRAESVAIVPSNPIKVAGVGILSARNTPIPGVTGNEKLRITLDKASGSDTVTIDLALTPQPPTLDSVATALNDAISAIPMRNPDGSVVLDANGNPTPRWLVHFVPDKSTDKWGFSVQAPNGAERVSIDQVDAKDSLIVATGQTAIGMQQTGAQMLRFDDAAGTMDKRTIGTITALDRPATERAVLAASDIKPVKGVTPPSTNILAATSVAAITVDAAGNSYVVGTTAGDMGANRAGEHQDLFLTKLDSEGAVLWQRSLGASGSALGAAVSLTASGDVVVAGTVNGSFDGAAPDGDMLVARFNAAGDETFASVIRSLGSDTATAITTGSDGSIFIGGKAATGGGDAFVARLDGNGLLQERRTINGGGSDTLTALAIGHDGNILALVNQDGAAQLRRIDAASLATDLGQIALGQADARSIAVAQDGAIAVVGSTSASLAGDQVNAMGSGRDGFVTRIDSGLSGASTSYIATASDDQVDSVAFLNGALYVGGRTTGSLDGVRTGPVDGFVSRLDAGTGAIESVTQFGQASFRTEPVRLAAASGGATILGALGLHRGVLNPESSIKLVAQTSLRPGDEFSLRVEGGKIRKLTIQADDTLASLASRVRAMTGSKAVVTTPLVGGSSVLRIEAKAGSSIELIAGASGKDALGKLGIEPARLSVPEVTGTFAPKVRPGGNFGLALSEALNLGTAKDAAKALSSIKAAISTTQTAYRSLYWDDGKAALANGGQLGGKVSAYQKAQLAGYQAALARLTPAADNSNFYTGF